MMNTTTITLAGNLTADPELRYTSGGAPVAQLRVLVNRRTRNAEGEWTDAEPTGWTCKVWGTAAENAAESVKKGDRVVIHGHVETETWNDKDTGDKRTSNVVNVDEIGVSLTWATVQPVRGSKPTTDDAGNE